MKKMKLSKAAKADLKQKRVAKTLARTEKARKRREAIQATKSIPPDVKHGFNDKRDIREQIWQWMDVK